MSDFGTIALIGFIVLGLIAWAGNSTDEPADYYAERIRELLDREPRP